jgi:hypothetical protein
MKEFDINKAKKGQKVITKEGKEAKILYFDRVHTHFPLIVLIDEKSAEYYSIDGKYYLDKNSDKDLIMDI